MTREEIQLRQLQGQHLLEPVDMETAARDLMGFQAQFLSNALHGLRLRSMDYDQEAARQLLVKSWTLRGTLHVFLPEDLPLFLHQGRKPLGRPCDTLEADDRITAERKRRFAALIVRSIGAGVTEREALRALCAGAGMTDREAESVFDPWGGTIRALCHQGTICHQVRQKKAFALCPPFTPMEKDRAELELARRYFAHFGPATLRDAAYFFGCPQAQVRSWLDRLPVHTAVCQGRTYFYLDRDTAPGAALPDCLLLAGFDQLLLGYQKLDSLYLPPEHLRGIFNRAGIVMPAVLLRGRVVGKWTLDGRRLRVTPFEPLGPEERALLARTAERLWDPAPRVLVE